MSDKSIVIPGKLSLRPLKPADIWERHVRARRVVYLDTNAWIRLTDARTQMACDCLVAAREAVRNQIAIFPLSFASIFELLHQPSNAPREAQAAIMDELSEGVIFRAADTVQREEARAAYAYVASGEHVPLDRSGVFTYVVDCLGDGQITFAPGTSVAQMNSLVEHWNSSIEFRSVLWFLKRLNIDQMKAHHVELERRFVELSATNIQRSEAHFRSQNQFSQARLQHEERAELLRSTVIPAFTQIILEDHPVQNLPDVVAGIMARFNEAHGRGSPQLLKTVFSLMPSMELFAQMMAARTMNPGRAVQPQDYWDVEHAQVAAAYGDAFVTLDRGLVDLLRARSTVPRDRGCRVLGSLTELMAFIGEDVATTAPEHA